MRTQRLLGGVVALATSFAMGSCAASTAAPAGGAAGPAAEPAFEVTPEMVNQGRQVFSGPGNCAVCHGPNATGGSLGPNLADDDWIWIDPSGNIAAQVVPIVRNGIPEPRQFSSPMPPMGGGAGLSDDQVRAVAAYIASLHGA